MIVVALAGCKPRPSPAPPPPPVPPSSSVPAPAPSYLTRLVTSGEVQTRNDKGDILPSRADDNAVLRGYGRWKEFGPLEGKAAERLTIMTAKTEYAANEEIRVIHVHEATAVGAELCIMGPKTVYGEWVDGVLKSEKADVPPLPYDGAVMQSPYEDHNYEVTVYRLPRGDHAIQWRSSTQCAPTPMRSNVLRLKVR